MHVCVYACMCVCLYACRPYPDTYIHTFTYIRTHGVGFLKTRLGLFGPFWASRQGGRGLDDSQLDAVELDLLLAPRRLNERQRRVEHLFLTGED